MLRRQTADITPVFFCFKHTFVFQRIVTAVAQIVAVFIDAVMGKPDAAQIASAVVILVDTAV